SSRPGSKAGAPSPRSPATSTFPKNCSTEPEHEPDSETDAHLQQRANRDSADHPVDPGDDHPAAAPATAGRAVHLQHRDVDPGAAGQRVVEKPAGFLAVPDGDSDHHAAAP